MADLRQGIPSPCNQICVLNADKICIGCGRSSEEIGHWSAATLDEQLTIVEQACNRLRNLQSNHIQQKESR